MTATLAADRRDAAALRVHLGLPGPMFAKQRAFVETVLSGGPELSTHAALGAWGSAKSTTGLIATIALAAQNGWHPGYGKLQPRTLIVAPTNGILRDVTIPAFEALLPDALILRRRLAPYTVTLVNGHVIALRSMSGEIEGATCTTVMLDEVQHDSYWSKSRTIPNMFARARDRKAAKRRLIVTGLPTAGFVRERFDRPNVNLVRFKARDNPAMTEDVIAEVIASCAPGDVPMIIDGEWGSPPGACFRDWNAATHLTDEVPPKGTTLHAAIDIGNHSHALVFAELRKPIRGVTGHEAPEPTMLGVDEIIQEGASLADLCMKLKIEKPYDFGRRSVICLDPTTRRDEVNVVRKHFPHARIIKRSSTDPYYEREPGLQLLEWGLLDALGNTRVRFNRALVKNGRGGVIYAMENSRRNPRTGKAVRDDVVDHSRDTARMAACYVLGDSRKGPAAVALR